MGRIRTVKPELAKHEALFDAEQRTGLPLRFAWAMLPTVCDREGRFVWRPRTLKADILPHDVLDFGAVLDAFLDLEMVRRYEVGGNVYGWIPTWHKHQSVNQREAASSIPPCPGDECAHVHAPGEGKGKEGNVKEGDHDAVIGHLFGDGSASEGAGLQRMSSSRGLQRSGDALLADFERFWAEYPRKDSRASAQREFLRIAPDEATVDRMIARVRASRASAQWLKDGGEFIPHGRTWLHQRRWEDETTAVPPKPAEAIKLARVPSKYDHIDPYGKADRA